MAFARSWYKGKSHKVATQVVKRSNSSGKKSKSNAESLFNTNYNNCRLKKQFAHNPTESSCQTDKSVEIAFSANSTTVMLPEGFTPLERIVLTSNGNLQRILSAYYNLPITVDVVFNIKTTESDLQTTSKAGLYTREINLVCNKKIICNAKSKIIVADNKFEDLINKGVGIGQLFQYTHIMPEFKLLHVKRSETNGLQRTYVLFTDGLRCEITESFPNLLLVMD